MRNTFLCILSLLTTLSCFSQKDNRSDRQIEKNLRKNISFLSDDKLEGRRTGTVGEQKAYVYISEAFKKAKLQPAGVAKGSFLQPFVVNEGKILPPAGNFLTISGTKLQLNTDYFPMPYSANGSSESKEHAMRVLQWINVSDIIKDREGNPHFDLNDAILMKIKAAKMDGANLVIFRNDTKEDVAFSKGDKTPALDVAVLWITASGVEKVVNSYVTASVIKYDITIEEKVSTGHNVVGMINNNAASTIVIGAHYDHLGYGQDHNSLYTGSTPQIHNGADDNASGTSALIELATWLGNEKMTTYNYLFVAFSGEELGLFGSKYFADNPSVETKTINYMINMDMVGRLNDSTKVLNIGGYGTSPSWSKWISANDEYFTIKLDSSGSGPSDHTSFYRKDIPVLFFFTGSHKDYHKPSDDADKINYKGEVKVIRYMQNIILQSAKEEKLAFTKTRETQVGMSSFKVSLGIMPDYTYAGSGVHVDGVSEGRAAFKAGILTGDVIIKLGPHPFTDVMSYMGALNKFEKGETTTVIFMRGDKEMKAEITF